MALLSVLLIGTVLAAMTAVLSYAVASHRLATGSRVSAQQNHFAMEGAVNVLDAQWRTGSLREKVLRKGVASGDLEIGAADVRYRMWDEATKLPLIQLSSEQIAGALREGYQAVLRSGAVKESDSPLLLESVFEVPTDQLGSVYGRLGQQDWESVAIDQFTLWTGGRVNVRTADEEVLRRRFADLGDRVVQNVLALKRFRNIRDRDALVRRLGLEPQLQELVALRLVTEPQVVTVRLSCHGPRLRTEGFAVLDVEESGLKLRLWHELPAAGPSRHHDGDARENRPTKWRES